MEITISSKRLINTQSYERIISCLSLQDIKILSAVRAKHVGAIREVKVDAVAAKIRTASMMVSSVLLMNTSKVLLIGLRSRISEL
jgi:hypothetical protein